MTIETANLEAGQRPVGRPQRNPDLKAGLDLSNGGRQ